MTHIDRHFKVTLHIRHPEMDPDTFTSYLSLEPRICHRIGDQRKNPKGDLLGGNYTQTYWTHSFDLTGVRDLFPYLDGLLTDLKPQKDFFRIIHDSGGEIELFCGIFTGTNWDEILPIHVSSKLVALRINLRLDAYPKETEPCVPANPLQH